MKVVTWNLNYWLSKNTHHEAWSYLRTIIKPDVALLQEVRPPTLMPGEALTFQEVRGGWGTGVYSRDLPLTAIPLCEAHLGRVAGATVTLGNGKRLLSASIHAYSDRVFPRLADIMDAIVEAFADRPAIVGGDLNSARLAEAAWPNYGHRQFWEKMDASRLVDCCQRMNGEELQTYFRKDAEYPFQDDHLFVSRDLASGLQACDVIDTEVTRRVSDHIPLSIELAI